MKLYNLGKVAWQDSQLMYHALAELGREALVLVSPQDPYVCLGFHQDARQEVDLAYCRANKIPVFRREVGGGAVYLDGDQLFYQLILRRNNPIVPKNKDAFYRKFLQPVINTYHRIGIPALYKPVNDVIINNRKIAGTGVAEIGPTIVFVGNLILDFNYRMMSRILKVPDEKFRDKVYKTLAANLTTIRRELGPESSREWDEGQLNRILAEEFQNLTGTLEPEVVDERLQIKMAEIGKRMLPEAHLLMRRRRYEKGRKIKIRADVNTIHRVHKAKGGLLRTDFVLANGCLQNVQISGDFFCYPKEAVSRVESAMEDTPIMAVRHKLETLLIDPTVDFPGISVEDWVKVLQ